MSLKIIPSLCQTANHTHTWWHDMSPLRVLLVWVKPSIFSAFCCAGLIIDDETCVSIVTKCLATVRKLCREFWRATAPYRSWICRPIGSKTRVQRASARPSLLPPVASRREAHTHTHTHLLTHSLTHSLTHILYIYTHARTHTNILKHTNTQTDPITYIKTHRHLDTHTHKYTYTHSHALYIQYVCVYECVCVFLFIFIDVFSLV